MLHSWTRGLRLVAGAGWLLACDASETEPTVDAAFEPGDGSTVTAEPDAARPDPEPRTDAGAPDPDGELVPAAPRLVLFVLPHGYAVGDAAPRADGLPPVLEGWTDLAPRISIFSDLALADRYLSNTNQHLLSYPRLLTGDASYRGAEELVIGAPSIDAVIAARYPDRSALRLASHSLSDDRLNRWAGPQPSWSDPSTPLPYATDLHARALELGLDPAALELGRDAPPPMTEQELARAVDAQLRLVDAAIARDLVRVSVVLTCDDDCPTRTESGESFYLAFHGPTRGTARDAMAVPRLHRSLLTVLGAHVRAWAERPTSDGRTLLDHTLVVVLTNYGNGATGSFDPLSHMHDGATAFWIGGGAYFREGLRIDAGGRPIRDLLATIAQGFGATTSYRQPAAVPFDALR